MTTPLDRFFDSDTEGDPLLGQLVHLDSAGWRLSLTVDGSVITGIVIGPHEYLRLLDESLRKYDLEMGSTAGYVRHGLGTADPRLNDLDPSPGPGMPRWIHLRNATTVRGEVLQKVGLWRGRMSAISGWTLRSPSRNG